MNQAFYSLLDTREASRGSDAGRSWPSFKNKDFLGRSFRTKRNPADDESARLLNSPFSPEEDHSTQDFELNCRTRRNGNNRLLHPVKSSAEGSENESNGRRIYSDSPKPFVDFVEWDVNEGDTLESLSLKSGCTISQIKRANNLISQQDFYALKTIRIPIKKYGILGEILVNTSTNEDDVLGHPSRQHKRLTTTSLMEAKLEDPRSKERNVQDFIKSLDQDMNQLKEKVNRDSPPRDDSFQVVPHTSLSSNKKLTQSHIEDGSSDFGLTFSQVICILLSVCILFPVIYFIFTEEKVAEHHNHTAYLHAQNHDHQPLFQLTPSRS